MTNKYIFLTMVGFSALAQGVHNRKVVPHITVYQILVSHKTKAKNPLKKEAEVLRLGDAGKLR